MTKETTQTQLKLTDLTRRQIRYICFRLQTEAEGGTDAATEETGIMSLVEDVKKHMETQDGFGSWKMFAKTWDVDETSPLVVIKRTSSIYTDWNNVLKEESKDLPKPVETTKIIELKEPKPKKNLARDATGKFISKDKRKESSILTPTSSDASETPKKKSIWDVLK